MRDGDEASDTTTPAIAGASDDRAPGGPAASEPAGAAELARVLERMSDAFVALDREWRYTYVNTKAGELFGRDPASLIGRNLWTEFPEAAGTPFRPAFEQAMSTQQTVRIEAYFAPWGVWFEARMYPAPDGLAVFFSDVTERRRADDERRALEARHRAAFQAARLGMLRTSLDGTFVEVNDALCRLLGYTADELVGRSYHHITHPDDLAYCDDVLTRLRAREIDDAEFEKRYVHKDGHTLRVRVTVARLAAAPGPVEFFAQVQDVGAFRETEARLQASERQFRMLAASSPVGIFQAGLSGAIDYANPHALALFGIAEEEATRVRWADRIHPDDVARVRAEWQAAVADGRSYEGEYRVVRPDGSERWVHGRSAPVRADDGTMVGVVGTMDDVTERRAAAAAAREAQEVADAERRRLAAVLAALPVGVAIADSGGRLLRVNGVVKRIWGGEPDLTNVDDRRSAHGWWAGSGVAVAADDWPIARALHGEVTVDREVDIERADGERATVLISAAPVRDGRGEIIGAVAVLNDITARKRLEGQVRQAQKMEALGQLAGGVAHDFNNLLTAIVGNVELVRGALTTPDEDPGRALEEVGEILRAAGRAASLTRQLLAFSRRKVLYASDVSLARITHELEPMLRRLLPANIELAILAGDSDGSVWANADQLEQVVVNLVVNARDALPDGGVVVIETATQALPAPLRLDGHALSPGVYETLVVADTGVGMNAEVRSRIFEPFYTTKPVGQGTGLGLAMVYGIVEQAGGVVDVRSEPGRGSRFTVWLPRHAANAAPPKPERLTTPPSAMADDVAGAVVLLVEDESAVRLAVGRMLERAGIHVLEARHGADALRLLESLPVRADGAPPVDLVLTDVVMPELDGHALLRALRDRRWHMPAVVMSGYAEVLDGARLDELEVVSRLDKPFASEELLGAVRGALTVGRRAPSSGGR